MYKLNLSLRTLDNKLNQDSNRMNNCAFDRKMNFNPDHWKQV